MPYLSRVVGIGGTNDESSGLVANLLPMISETALYIGKRSSYLSSSSSVYLFNPSLNSSEGYCCLGLENSGPNIFFNPLINLLVVDFLLSDGVRSLLATSILALIGFSAILRSFFESLVLLFWAYTSFFNFSALFLLFSLSSSGYVGFIFNVLIMRLIHSNKLCWYNRSDYHIRDVC